MKKSLKLSLFLTAMFCWISNLQSQSWSAPNLDQNTYRNGNVAIGLTTPQAKLHLSKTTLEDVINIGDPIPTHPSYFPHIRFNNFVEKGGMIAKEVKVRSDFADYVFEKDYNLLSLKEVESHIQEKGHLHNTPSAKNIQKNGLNVSEITTNQQEKIEELFLHLIEMEKRIEELEKENQALKSQILKK